MEIQSVQIGLKWCGIPIPYPTQALVKNVDKLRAREFQLITWVTKDVPRIHNEMQIPLWEFKSPKEQYQAASHHSRSVRPVLWNTNIMDLSTER